jgi:hypothetical protein
LVLTNAKVRKFAYLLRRLRVEPAGGKSILLALAAVDAAYPRNCAGVTDAHLAVLAGNAERPRSLVRPAATLDGAGRGASRLRRIELAAADARQDLV